MFEGCLWCLIKIDALGIISRVLVPTSAPATAIYKAVLTPLSNHPTSYTSTILLFSSLVHMLGFELNPLVRHCQYLKSDEPVVVRNVVKTLEREVVLWNR